MIKAEEFVNLFRNTKQTKLVRYGTITDATGKPRVRLDGEATASIKRYTRLASYTPVIGDRVAILNGFILGKII